MPNFLAPNSEGANIWHEPVIWQVPVLFNEIVYIFLLEDLDKNQSKLKGLGFVWVFLMLLLMNQC